MSQVSVQYTAFEPKKHSIRMKTEERLDQEYNLPDVYVPRSVLRALGVENGQQDRLTHLVITYSLEQPKTTK